LLNFSKAYDSVCHGLFILKLRQRYGRGSCLSLGDDFIPYAFKAKNLGVTFSYDLNWGDHVCTICRKVNGALAGLRRLADVTPFTVRM
jgi:hypothetical protein